MTSRGRAARTIGGVVLVTALDSGLLMLALGGPLPLLHHAQALALLAVWFLGGLTLGLLRPVRTHDPVSQVPEPRATLVALFVIPLLLPPVAAWGERMQLGLLPGGLPLRWAGVAVAAIGFAIRIGAMARLGSRFSPLLVTQKLHALETTGLYAVVRHPGYLGTLLLALGAVLAFGSALGFVLLLPLAVLLELRTRREDVLLERAFGDEFRRWRARTGRFLPRIGR